jgi:riboflavin synthase
MFTGLVEEVGTILRTAPNKLVIGASTVMNSLTLGESIATNGACLTVMEIDSETFTVELSNETLSRTNLGHLEPHDPVNLERALPAGARMGGHFVQGHVDRTGTVLSLEGPAHSCVLQVRVPSELLKYVTEKGFIAIDGISLTITSMIDSVLAVSVIPYTLNSTNLNKLRGGSLVNLEVDILAKYVERILSIK